jgi:Tfp pilus assembly protein PilO
MKNLMPLVFIVVSVGIFFVYIDPLYKEIQGFQKTIIEQEDMLVKAQELRQKREQLQQKYNDIGEEDRERLEKMIPNTVDNVQLILDINNIASDFGIAITDIGVTEESEGGGTSQITENTGEKYGTIELSFSVSATYETFKRFLETLEDSLRLVDVTSFTVNAGDQVFYNYTVNLQTYWLR